MKFKNYGYEPLNNADEDNERNVAFASARRDKQRSHSDTETDVGGKIELRSRGGSSQQFSTLDEQNDSNVVLFERKIKESETLLKISLQYNIPLSELKRVNNLMTDQQFYALSYIKIPVQKYSYLETLLQSEQNSLLTNANFSFTNRPGPSHTSLQVARSSASRTSSYSDTESTGATKNQQNAKTFLSSVDLTIAQAKNFHERREARTDGSQALVDTNLDDIDDMVHLNGATRRAQFTAFIMGVKHYVVVVLLVMLIISVPVIIFAMVSDNDDNNNNNSRMNSTNATNIT